MRKPQAATVRNVNAALRAADIKVYVRPKAQYTHDGQPIQTTGYYGTKADRWGEGQVRVSPEIKVSTAASQERRQQALLSTVAAHVAALGAFTCEWNARFGCLIVSAAAS